MKRNAEDCKGCCLAMEDEIALAETAVEELGKYPERIDESVRIAFRRRVDTLHLIEEARRKTR